LARICSRLHAALAEGLAVQEDGGHRHDLARLDFRLEERAVDRDVGDVRVQHRHQVQRLHHVRAVLAAQREIGLEMIVALERLDLIDQIGLDLRRMAADVQQGEHQRGELVAQGQAGETHARIARRAVDGERRPARIIAALYERHLVGSRSHVVQKREHLLRLGALIDGGDQLDGLAQVREIGRQL
jgi:hypothetical protein